MKSENDMNDQELEEFEKSTKIVQDRLDRLELIRRALNSSRVEQIYSIKRSSNLGPQCPYYKKARRLFEENQQVALLQSFHDILKEFEEPNG
jgi:hypothetical protein